MKGSWFFEIQLLLLPLIVTCQINNVAPRFSLSEDELVVHLKEGPATPVGTKILSLRASDEDGDELTFGVVGDALGFVRVENLGKAEGSLILAKELDAEIQNEYTIILTLTDGKLGEGNYITQSMLILVEDLNDNSPVFLPYSSTLSIKEHSAIPIEILRIRASDRDSGIFGQVIYSLSLESGEEDVFQISTEPSGEGLIRLVKELDYEVKSVYQLKVIASDRGQYGEPVNSATAAILVQVEDVPDMPPEFVYAPSITRISEDVLKLTEIARIKAVDGDKGIRDPVFYSIVDGPSTLFGVNEASGVIYTKSLIDREDSADGTYILRLRASEPAGSFVETEMTVIVEDVNDEIPTFRSSRYEAEISENAQKNTPVTFLDNNVLPEVVDRDRGSNGTFELLILGDNGVFEVTPESGVNEATFVVKVKDSSLLDYENLQVMEFTVTAREKGYPSHQSSTQIRVHIRDQNDNSPEFSQNSYSTTIREDIQPGDVVAVVNATDRDSNSFGTQGIRYTGLSGPLADKLRLDPITGIITLLEVPSPFDHEKSEFHYLTVEARDVGGTGNRNTAELIIKVIDVNDNAPKFHRESYEAYIMENSPRFISALYVKARDSDSHQNGLIRYKILNGSNFTIDPESGRISPSGRLDFESLRPGHGSSRPINFTVRAHDQGLPVQYTDVNVTIFVMDENDHEPVFERDLYEVSIPEDVQGGTQITQVKAFDGDGTQPNNKIAYRISSGAKDKFVIDADSGIITVSQGANLDPDLTFPHKTVNYLLKVMAIDGGLGRDKLTGSTFVNITIKDLNNKSPRFVTESPNVIHVLENVNNGHFLTQINATDLDLNARIEFSIDPSKCSALDEYGNHVDYDMKLFEIDSMSGDLRIKGRLDREVVSLFKICIVAEDISAVKGPDGQNVQKDVMYLSVEVEDVNDNSPIFGESSYTVAIPENLPKHSKILEVNARDLDVNRSITYSMDAQSEIKKYIQVDSKTGMISVRAKIDAEIVQWLNFSVVASDNGVPIRSSRSQVSVNILDLNDNAPYFEEPGIQNLTVREDAPVGTVITRIQARDDDISKEFGKITYFLDSNSAIGKFRMNPDTGELSISESLNREENRQFTLIIQAYDNYQYGFTTGDAHHAFIQLYIQISDVNDEIPIFQEVPEHCTVITEFHEFSETILTVRAIDMDDPDTMNGRLHFTIKNGNELDLFRLENFQNSAKLFPNQPLKGYFGNYSLIIRVSDGGHPPNTNEAQYNVCVQDFNDNAPVFIQPPRNFTIRIPENMTVGSEIIQVLASDTDIGSNGAVRYRLRNDPAGDHASFVINSTSGVIKLQQTLDRERQKIYEIRVEAYDLGVPTSLQSDLDLKIFIRNVNDHEPQFLVNEFHANFTEEKPPGKERVLLVNTVDRDDVDDDEVTLLKDVCYFIVGGSNRSLFDLHPTQHELITNEILDREQAQEHELIIKATEECFNIPKEVIAFDPDDDTLLRVRVHVNDINDNPPQFDKKVFTGGIASDREFGAVFMSVSAHDTDINSELSYSISSEITHSNGSEGIENVHKPEFVINANNGELLVNFDVQKNMKGFFQFTVRVEDEKSDSLGHFDESEVRVYLLRPDQRVRFVIRSRPSEIRERINEFRDVLHDVTDAVVNVDALLVHKEEGGVMDSTKTDVLLHFVNPKSNTVFDVEKVLKLIDYKTEELDNIFKDFNVLYTDGVEPKFLFQKSSFVSETYVIFWLIGLLALASFLLFLVICLCMRQKQKFRRRLRAATVSIENSSSLPQESSPSSAKNKETVPNTNLHASEGSNPIWLSSLGYDNFTYEECNKQQNQDNSLDANVLNQEESEDYEDSTIRLAQKTNSPHYSESSSGLGSGSSRRAQNTLFGASSGSNASSTFRNRNLSIAALFPAQMPPVEKLNNPLVKFGVTTYDEDDIPRTEL